MALRTKDGQVDKGVSLARFPALVVGSILLTFGLLAFLTNGDTPTGGFPDGTVQGENFLGFEINGWTAWFTCVAGGLLLFGAAQHLLAKTMSLLVGLALGACSVIALVDGDDVLGLAAANGWTMLGWGVAAAFLLINTLLPRKGGRRRDPDAERERVPAPTRREPVATREPSATDTAAARREPADDERVTRVDAPGTTRPERDRVADDTVVGERSGPDRDYDDGSVADDRVRR